ncbi:hypothetical protein O3M35_000597 [Rhynocoris fuscipes]|uniref:Nuclear envelope integral membrane protein 1 n=1 Tax=Rhynocoris fuscipes TaxID=488301 RepID=A0AAW1DMD7_9HEMI
MLYKIYLCQIVLLVFLVVASTQLSSTYFTVKFLDESNNSLVGHKNYLEIYCYKGRLKHIEHMWETVQIQISLHPDEFTYFEGINAEDVVQKYDQLQRSWHFNIMFNKRQIIKLNPFNQTCIGVKAVKDYDIKLHRIRVDYWRILLCLSGFALFVSAPSLSTNSLFYYLTGISVGVFASVLIFVYILSRFMPRKPIMYSFLAGGWTIGIYIVQLIGDNLRLIAMEYKSYVFYYILFTGIISFVVCYRYGPVSDPKSINLIRWALQGVALMMVFFSSDFQEASMFLNFILLLHNCLPVKRFWQSLCRITKCWFPPKPTLLSEDEYHLQGMIETQKALESLRGYCTSPQCNQWRTVLKLKDPIRFAKFMEGSSHIQDEEVLAYETDTKVLRDGLLTDDDSVSSDEE